MATLIGISEQNYGHTVNRPTDPPFSVVVAYARSMMVSVDWLAGFDVPMWSQPLQSEWHGRIAEVTSNYKGTRYADRVCHLLREMHAMGLSVMFLTALARMAVSEVQEIVDGKVLDVAVGVGEELVAGFGVTREWLHFGE